MKAWPLVAAPALIFGTLYAIGRGADDSKSSGSKVTTGPSVSAPYYPEPSKHGFSAPAPGDGKRSTVAPDSTASLLPNVGLRELKWQATGFGAVMVASFMVRNGTDIHIKDLQVECSLYGKSGTQVGTASTTIYERLAPRQERRIRELNMGFIHNQAASADCRITHFERA
jgi:hypothetical protein